MSEATIINRQVTVEGATTAKLVPNLAAAATTHGLKAEAPVPGTLMISRRFLPRWAVCAGIALIGCGFALGSLGAGPIVWALVGVGVLLMVFVRQNETVALVIADSPTGARVDATGVASGKLEEFVGGLLPAR